MNKNIAQISAIIEKNIHEKKLIDRDFLEQIIYIVSTNEDLSEFIHNLEFANTRLILDNPPKQPIINYSLLTKDIIINLAGAIELSCVTILRLKNLTEPEQLTLFYIYITLRILHELGHITHEKIKQNPNPNDIETLILLACDKELDYFLNNKLITSSLTKAELNAILRRIQKKRDRYAEFAPDERLAENYAITMMLEIISNISYRTPSITKYLKYLQYENWLKGYDQTSSPTKLYLEQTGRKKEWQEISHLAKDQSLKDSLSLGLAIRDEEYNTTLNQARTLKKQIFY